MSTQDILSLYPKYCCSKEELSLHRKDFERRCEESRVAAEFYENLYAPTNEEIRDFYNLCVSFKKAKVAKDYSLSDNIRKEILLWQASITEEEILYFTKDGVLWYSYDEPLEHRLTRLNRRINVN